MEKEMKKMEKEVLDFKVRIIENTRFILDFDEITKGTREKKRKELTLFFL